jgi:tetratricopeptide (TPR) repeat protein
MAKARAKSPTAPRARSTARRAEPPSFAVGEAKYRAGAYAEAETVFRALSAANPGDATAMRVLGLCRLRLGDQTEALSLLEKAHGLAPTDPYGMLHYGLGLHAVKRHAEAAAQFRACAPLLAIDPAPYLNLSAALLGLDDAHGALDAARRARRRAPKLPQASYMVGMAYLAADRLDDALQAFAEALRYGPDLADAWVNIGVIRYRRDDIEGAKAAMRRALAIAPDHNGAIANLGAFLRLTGQVEASEKLFEDVLARNPDAAEARVNQAVALLSEERPAEALALLDAKPVPDDPALARHWQMQRSLALLQTGRISEAREAIAAIGDVPPELAPLMLWRRVLLSVADGDREAARAFALEMEKALAATNKLVPEHRIMAHFDLGRFWSQQRDAEHTFANWIAGHRQLGRFQPFSRDAHRAFVDASIAQLDRARFAEGPRAQNRDEAPIFIVGMPRSGTTLAEQIIAAHPQAFGAGERGALYQTFNRLGGDNPQTVSRLAATDAAELDRAATTYLAELHALAPDKARIVDKMPGNFNYLGLVGLMLPGARIIHCVRDPRDIGLSIFTFRFYGYHPYAHDLGDLGWYIAEHARLMAHWRQVLPNPILTLALKDWVEDFDGTLRRVLDFIDLPYDETCERFYESDARVRTVSRAQVRQPVNARGLGRWRGYAAQLQPLIAALEEGGATLDDSPS